MYQEPASDGTFIPTIENEPSLQEVSELFEFSVVTEDTIFVYDPIDQRVMHTYELRQGALGVWRWKGMEVRESEYVCPDPKCDYDHSKEVEFTVWSWMTNDEGLEELVELGWIAPTDTPEEAMMESWWVYYTTLNNNHSQ